MKPLSFMALVFAAFLIFLGYSSRQTAGVALGNAVMVGGIFIAAVVAGFWIAMFIKEKKEKKTE